MRKVHGLLAVTVLVSIPIWAQQGDSSQASDNSAMMQKIRELEERVISLEGQVRVLKSQLVPTPAAPAGGPATGVQTATAVQEQASTPGTPSPTAAAPLNQEQALSLGGAGVSASKALNPDMSVIGDFIGAVGHNPLQPSPSLEMHESEAGFQAIIDPYARGDFFLSFGEEGVGLEEGYITFTALPAGFVAKAGKMRSAFGKVNTLHNHVLPWVDRPLVTNNLVGGEDGLNDAGFSLQRILPAPKWLFLEATGQVFRGDSGSEQSPLFRASSKSDVSAVAHLRSYLAMSKATGETEHLKDMLVGNILAVSMHDVAKTAILYGIVGIFHYIFRKQFLLISTNPAEAETRGLSIRFWDFLFYASFGFVVTSSVAIAGVLLVFCYLVVPSVGAMLFADRIGRRLAIGWTMGTLVSALGVYFSVWFDLPTGATIVCTFGAVLAVLMVMFMIHLAFFHGRPGACPGKRHFRGESERACLAGKALNLRSQVMADPCS
jgi:zinc/manganese transport system permease protein